MKEEEKYQRTDEIIAKFKNGRERYMESALFNQVVQMLVRDADVYMVIDQLIRVSEDCQNALVQRIHRAQTAFTPFKQN